MSWFGGAKGSNAPNNENEVKSNVNADNNIEYDEDGNPIPSGKIHCSDAILLLSFSFYDHHFVHM